MTILFHLLLWKHAVLAPLCKPDLASLIISRRDTSLVPLHQFVGSIWEKEGGFEEHRGRAVLHSVTTGLSVSFVLFPRVQKQIALSILLLDTSVVSIPEQQYLERSLIISTLSFYTHMSLTQFRWSKHSGPVIFVRSMCTQSLALQGPSPMDNIKCFSDINAK